MVNIHLKMCASCTPRKPSGGEAIIHSNHTRQTPHHLSCSDLGRAQNTGPTESAPLRTTRVPEPEWLGPGKCRQPRPNIHLFDDWLKKHKGVRTNRSLTDNSVKAYHSRMRAFISEAVSFGIITQNPYDQFKTGRCQTMPRMYLTMEELDMLRTWQPPKSRDNSRQKALDLFLIQCYTGLSYSDLMATDFTITEEHEGNLILPRTTRVKTGTQFYIMLLPPVLEILNRYSFKPPYMSLQSYSAQLKLIEEETNIGKHITSHVGRHTFATTIALGSGIPIEVVSKMLGHTNIQTTQIYAKIMPKQVLEGFHQIKKVVS